MQPQNQRPASIEEYTLFNNHFKIHRCWFLGAEAIQSYHKELLIALCPADTPTLGMF